MNFPDGKYGAILADPPWYFRAFSKAGEGRSATTHYKCMGPEEITSLPVESVAADDCALFLWVTDPFLPQGLELMAQWGFEYKTVAFTWAKTNKSGGFFTGMGYWSRSNPEMCLLGTRGKPKRLNMDVRQLIVSERREHSRKPDEVHERIGRLVPGPYLELFARRAVSGWTCWGNEVDKF